MTTNKPNEKAIVPSYALGGLFAVLIVDATTGRSIRLHGQYPEIGFAHEEADLFNEAAKEVTQ